MRLTYSELLKLFLERHSEFNSKFSDYRPAQGKYSIEIWLKDRTSIIATYKEKYDKFEIVSNAN